MKCAFVGCYRQSIGITMKQVSKNKYADIPTCAYDNHWLLLRQIWDLDILQHFFSFKIKRRKSK